MRALGAVAALWCAGVSAVFAAESGPLLHAMFQDHAVLQRDQPIRVWGQAQPGAEVRIAFAGKRTSARADAEGRWQAPLPPLPAGGPHTLVARSGSATQTVRDVLVGDVWLCSGQSNMELPVWRALDARAEIAGAANDRIRLFTVPQAGSATPRETFAAPTRWQQSTSESVRDFSAACYYFARELQKTVDVPMGLINAAWGGSRIQGWISSEGLRATGLYDDELDVLALYARDPVAAAGRWGEAWSAWWHGLPGIAAGDEPWKPDATHAAWRAAPRELVAWEHWGVPELADFNGMLWYRTTLALTAQQAAQDAVLSMGAADEIDLTWVNGRAVGSAYGGNADDRHYRLPKGLLRAGENVVVVNVLDTYSEGGLVGPASTRALRFADGSSVRLDGAWQYRIVTDDTQASPIAPWQSAAGLSTLYNAMIAPIGPYGLRGIAWYQGESNTFEAERYRDLLRALRRDWRMRFGEDLPLLVAQLANYGPAPTRPGESEWAELREAQRQAVAEDARTGLAVTIDIGDRYDLHPPNKQELGRRLARTVRHAAFGEAIPPSGPVPLSAKREGTAVSVRFGDVTNGLVAYGANGPIGFELCGAQAGSCRYADAEIRGDTVLLRAPVADAVRVRYGWADSPVVTLFDGAGLPAGPFEIPIQ
ncbi:MAG TPA: sialate O-acetylesterase [Xanthomonadaceae bacterium]|nr:sialate O-acetylesterase [Xanthomonadaceae bacterium]